MVGCQCDHIIKLEKKKKKTKRKKPFSHSIEKETLLGDALTFLPLLPYSTSRVCELFLHADIIVSEPFSHSHLMQL
jgi:hypothetical protein